MIAALMLLWNLSQLWRETNSHAATSHGIKAFTQKKYADAAKSFGSANAISPSPRRAFNLGTAQIAAGNREVGSSTLAKAVADPHLATRGIIHRHDQAPGIEGPFGVPLAAFTFAHGGPRIDTLPPRLGEHNDEVFGELGIGRLRKAKGERPSRAP